jgi:N-acetylglucosamine-6-phosphate deacetylase
MTIYAIAADYVFDGCALHRDAAVVIEGSQIVRVEPRSKLPAHLRAHRLPQGAWIAPGFIDLQVNGGGDVLFNNAPTPETIIRMADAHRKFGTTAMLPTLITDTPEKTRAAMAAAREAMKEEPGILGIHLEGPFLSREKAGVHDPELMRRPDEADLQMLCGEWPGMLLVTLAPECVPQGFISRLVAAGRLVSLGHSAATYEETRSAMGEGLSGFTHLFNAMRQLGSRDPGPIAAALESTSAWYGLIVDGWHVSPATLRLALRGLGQPMLVTDAMPPVGGSQSAFTLYENEIKVTAGHCLDREGKLAGAALDMASAVRNCVNLVGVSLAEALRLASRNPAEFLGLGHMLGKLAPDYRADLVALDPETVTVLRTWVAGIDRSADSRPIAACDK